MNNIDSAEKNAEITRFTTVHNASAEMVMLNSAVFALKSSNVENSNISMAVDLSVNQSVANRHQSVVPFVVNQPVIVLLDTSEILMVHAFPRRIVSHVMTMNTEMVINAFVNQVTIATRTLADVSHSQNALKMRFSLTGLVFVKMDIFVITIAA